MTKQGKTSRSSDSSASRNNPMKAGAPTTPKKTPQNLVAAIAKRQGALSGLRDGYRKERRKIRAEAVGFGLSLAAAGPETWREFMDLDFWDQNSKARPKEGEQKDAVRFVVRLYHNEEKRAAKIASEVAKAVNYLIQSGLPDASIPEEIIRGKGIRALCDLAGPKQVASPTPRGSGVEKPVKTSVGIKPDWTNNLLVQMDPVTLKNLLTQPGKVRLVVELTSSAASPGRWRDFRGTPVKGK